MVYFAMSSFIHIECFIYLQGCIAEQRIEHTCGESNPESDTAHQDLDRSYSHDSIVSFG